MGYRIQRHISLVYVEPAPIRITVPTSEVGKITIPGKNMLCNEEKNLRTKITLMEIL